MGFLSIDLCFVFILTETDFKERAHNNTKIKSYFFYCFKYNPLFSFSVPSLIVTLFSEDEEAASGSGCDTIQGFSTGV